MNSAATTHPHWVLTTAILASGLSFIDGSVVNVGLSALGATFKAGASDLQWVINAYLLPLSALLLGGAAEIATGTRVFWWWGPRCSEQPRAPARTHRASHGC